MKLYGKVLQTFLITLFFQSHSLNLLGLCKNNKNDKIM